MDILQTMWYFVNRGKSGKQKEGCHMANKDKKKKRLMTGTDIALAILAALGGSVLFMTVVLVAGSIMFPDFGRGATADAPSARPSYYGTLPSRAPTREPTPEPTESIMPDDTSAPEPTQMPSEAVPDTPAPAPSQAPAQTQPPAPSRTQAPSAPVPTRAPTPTRGPAAQNPGPVVSINPTAPPTRQTQAPAQAGNQGGGGRGDADNFNAYNNPDQQQTAARYVLNTSTMKFHNPTCNDVARIARQNYAESNLSRDEIMRNGYSPCGHCNP